MATAPSPSAPESGDQPMPGGQRVLLVGGAMRSGTTVIHRALCTARNSNPYLSESWLLRNLIRFYKHSLVRYEHRCEDQIGPLENLDGMIRMNVRYYCRAVSERFDNPDVLIFKHPELIKHFLEFGQLFPRMRFLGIVRDPRDAIASMKRIKEKHGGEGFRTVLSEFSSVADMCTYYEKYYDRILRFGGTLGGRLMMVRYEDVMRDPGKEVVRIGAFCGAEYDMDDASGFRGDLTKSRNLDREYRLSDPIGSAFWSELYTRDLSTERIGRFAEILTKDEVKAIETRLAAIGGEFGYW